MESLKRRTGLAVTMVWMLGGAAMGKELASFQAKDVLGLDWNSTLVTYEVPFNPAMAKARLVDQAGRETTFQIWHMSADGKKARISFMAQLKKDNSYKYALIDEEPTVSPAVNGRATAPEVVVDGTWLTIDNGVVAIRLPKTGTTKFADKPVNLSDDRSQQINLYDLSVTSRLPGPIQGVRLSGGQWVGGSCFYATDPKTAPKVTGFECKVTERGPLFVGAVVRYEFDNGGYYQCSVRVLAGDPAVRIDELSDLKQVSREWPVRLAVSLSGPKWKPDEVWWQSPAGRLPGHDAVFERNIADMGFDTKAFQSKEYGSIKVIHQKAGARIFKVACWYPWDSVAYYFGLADSEAIKKGVDESKTPFLAVVPMHAGTWRGAVGTFNGQLVSTSGGEVCIQWPMVAGPHPNTLLDTGEYDPDLPWTMLRRQWALIAGPLQYLATLQTFRKTEGFVNLDNYKDWILDWPEQQPPYPRLVFSAKDVERLRPALDQMPGGEALKKFLYFTDNEQRREQLWSGLTNNSEWSGPRGQAICALTRGGDDPPAPWCSHYRQTQMAGWAGNMDELLSSSKLTPAQRRTLQAQLAALCYTLTEPDVNPRGMMVHLGNPNMPINRFMALPFTASLISDHPRAKEWMDVSAAYVRYKLAMNTAPGGAWSELLTYFGASAPSLMQAATVLGAAGRLDESTANLVSMPARFTVQLTSPRDPRFGTRMLPQWGHEGYDTLTHYMVAAGLMRQRDPELAKALVWAWDQLGRPMVQHHDAGFSERVIVNADLLKELSPGWVPPELASAWLPGFGVTMRAHAGAPNETWLSYRQGYLASHSDSNQGDFILYAKGAALSTLSIFAYPTQSYAEAGKAFNEFGWHNRVRFGTQGNTGGWPGGGLNSQVHAYSFSDSADYCRGVGDYGPQTWQRQVAFLKGKKADGPNYFVLRDSFNPAEGGNAGLEEKWWYLRTPGKKDLLKTTSGELTYTSPFGPKLNARFIQPAQAAPETREVNMTGPLYNQSAINWRNARSPIVKEDSQTSVTVSETLSITAFGPVAPGQDIVVALYPQTAGESLPKYESLADGATRITTNEGTDYVFLSGKPMAFQQDDVSMRGKAGMVRVYADEVHLIVAEGPGEVTYRGTTLRSEVPACKIIPLAQLKKETIAIAAPQHDITFSLSGFEGAGQIKQIQAGVRKLPLKDGFAVEFDSLEPLKFAAEGLSFSGNKGGIVVDNVAKTVRLVMIKGQEVSYQYPAVPETPDTPAHTLSGWGCDGPYDLTFHADHISGRSAGLGRFLYLTRPTGLDKLPMYVLDGQTFAPGTNGDVLILPIMPGLHNFDIRILPQPPIWRTWQQW